MLLEGQKFKKVLQQISSGIRERFPSFLQAYRLFNIDLSPKLTLNNFIKGVEYLKINIDTKMIKDVFAYLDFDNSGSITYGDFAQLSEENLSKKDVVEFAIASLKLKRRSSNMSMLNSIEVGIDKYVDLQAKAKQARPRRVLIATKTKKAAKKRKFLEEYLQNLKKIGETS